jgi:hypothetical protein
MVGPPGFYMRNDTFYYDPYMTSLKGHPNLKPGAEGPSETEASNRNEEVPQMDGND